MGTGYLSKTDCKRSITTSQNRYSIPTFRVLCRLVFLTLVLLVIIINDFTYKLDLLVIPWIRTSNGSIINDEFENARVGVAWLHHV